MIEWLFAAMLVAWFDAAPPALTAAAPGIASDAAAKPSQAAPSDLDRLAFAIEGAESSHGRDRLMWQPNRRGPQGPMQVTQAAALDVGSGNRFDIAENRQLGRAYLAAMLRRYGNWVDAVAAYNWGPGNLDRWIAAGRPATGLSAPIQSYIQRIMSEFRGETAIGTVPAAAVPMIARSISPARALAAAPPPEIKDPALKKAFEQNAAAIRQIGDFLDGDKAAESAARDVMRTISGRRGYEEFKRPGAANPRAPSSAAMRDIARVMLGKLQSENAAIILVDKRRDGRFQ